MNNDMTLGYGVETTAEARAITDKVELAVIDIVSGDSPDGLELTLYLEFDEAEKLLHTLTTAIETLRSQPVCDDGIRCGLCRKCRNSHRAMPSPNPQRTGEPKH